MGIYDVKVTKGTAVLTKKGKGVPVVVAPVEPEGTEVVEPETPAEEAPAPEADPATPKARRN